MRLLTATWIAARKNKSSNQKKMLLLLLFIFSVRSSKAKKKINACYLSAILRRSEKKCSSYKFSIHLKLVKLWGQTMPGKMLLVMFDNASVCAAAAAIQSTPRLILPVSQLASFPARTLFRDLKESFLGSERIHGSGPTRRE